MSAATIGLALVVTLARRRGGQAEAAQTDRRRTP
jgi:hypothetical protein